MSLGHVERRRWRRRGFTVRTRLRNEAQLVCQQSLCGRSHRASLTAIASTKPSLPCDCLYHVFRWHVRYYSGIFNAISYRITVYSGLNVLRLRYNSSHVHSSHKGFTLSKSRNRKSVVQNSRWPTDSLSYNIVSILAYSTFLKFGRHRNRLTDFKSILVFKVETPFK